MRSRALDRIAKPFKQCVLLCSLVAVLFAGPLIGCGGASAVTAIPGLPPLDRLVLRPNTRITQTPADFGFEYEEIALPVGEGRSIVAWHVFAERPRALVLILPGSDSNKGRYAEALPLLVPRGYECVLIDYEGYGNSPGEPSLAHTVDDAYAAVAYALSRNPNTVVFAVSLGTPLAVRVAADFDLKGIILDGTFVAEHEAALWLVQNGDTTFGGIANWWVEKQAPEAFDILKYIRRVQEPKLFMHSPEDEVTPYAGGRMVFDAAPEPKEFWDMRGGHGQMIRLDTAAYEARVTGFIESVIGRP
jgi:pimeloyl-ACP methyl ester carboxylesterase